MEDECSEITNPEECYDMGCEWIILYEEMDNEIIVTEGCSETGDGSDWDDEENSCEGLRSSTKSFSLLIVLVASPGLNFFPPFLPS